MSPRPRRRRRVKLPDGSTVTFDGETFWRYDRDGEVVGVCQAVADAEASYPHWVEQWISKWGSPEGAS